MFRCSTLFLAALVLCLNSAFALDTVTVKSGQGGQLVLHGEITEFNGKQLLLSVAGGRQRQIDAEHVLDVDTAYLREHRQANDLYKKYHFEQALSLYRKAREEEPRRWVRRRLTAQMVKCYRATGQTVQACHEFLLLADDDPDMLYLDCIPLAWIPSEPSGMLEREARAWIALQINQNPMAVLLGASQLLATMNRSAALEQLKKLVYHKDRRVAQLAMCQLWRTEAITADDARLATWAKAVELIPRAIRAGPYYVLALGRAHRGQWEQASLTALRLPILYPDNYRLSAHALHLAARALEKTGRTDQSDRLYRELLDIYPQTKPAAEARQQLQERSKEK